MLVVLLPLQVRDRATLYLDTFGGDGTVLETDKNVKDFLFGYFDVPLVNLENSLKHYVRPSLFFFLFICQGHFLNCIL